MTIHGKTLAVAIPDTVLEEHDSVRDKTAKLGIIARACAIFGVDSIVVFRDPAGRGEVTRIVKVLRYLDTPQYLRKHLFQFEEDLNFAGILPPLRTPSHKPKIPIFKVRQGDIREGVVVSKDGYQVFVGLDRNATLKTKSSFGERITVRIVDAATLIAERVDRREIPEYWGYAVQTKELAELLRSTEFDLRIATSRLGDDLSSAIGQLRGSYNLAKSILLIFGSPSKGLFEMVGKDLRKKVDFVLNLYSKQNVATVRTEEALMSGLYLLEVLSLS